MNARWARFIDPEIVQRLLKIADMAVLFPSSVLMLIGATAAPQQQAIFNASSSDTGLTVGFMALAIALLSLLASRTLRLYSTRMLLRPFKSATLAAFMTALIGTTVVVSANLTIHPVDPAWFSAWLFLCVAYFLVSKVLVAAWARPLERNGTFRKRIAVVGGGKAAEDAIRMLEASDDLDVEIVGLFDDRDDDRSPASINQHAKIGTISDLYAFARNHRVDLIIVAIPLSAETRLLHMLKSLWELPVDIRISGQASQLKLAPGAYTNLGDLPLLSVFERPLSSWGALTKDVMDRVLAAVFIVLLSPVMLGVAVLIRFTSEGPVIFRQRRYGFNNELIEVFKFRSMYTDRCDAEATQLVTRGDPRVTPIGRFIRKTSIDELPQLFNVLTGQLSLVGPRPHATQAKAAEQLYDQAVEGYFARHRVKPGITGWAQVNGWRGETDTHEKIQNRVKHDLEYIDRWSLLFDLYIIAKTPFALLSTGNAEQAY